MENRLPDLTAENEETVSMYIPRAYNRVDMCIATLGLLSATVDNCAALLALYDSHPGQDSFVLSLKTTENGCTRRATIVSQHALTLLAWIQAAEKLCGYEDTTGQVYEVYESQFRDWAGWDQS